jgi:ATP-dependent DNA ligase
MALPIPKHYTPMEALPASELPAGPQWQYEPKWDGFRSLVFRPGKSTRQCSLKQVEREDRSALELL